jgi:hypothetical protein
LKETNKGAPVRPVGLPVVDLLEAITLDIKAEAGKSGSRSAHCELWGYSRRIGLNAAKAELSWTSDKLARP